jgi:Mn2+/Fe2+ NRAMP family transporter
VFLTYIVAGFLAKPDWSDVLRHTLIPSFEINPAYIAGSLALLGSTLTSYVYFWETIEEEEEHHSYRRLGYVQFDAGAGILFTVIIFWFITISSGATAGLSGIHVQTAQDAAIALTPLAGPFATQVFALGLLASALLALPVLAATTAYVVTETFDIGHGSVEESVNWNNLPFYMVIILGLIVSAAISYIGIEPIQLLFFASIAGGLGTPVLLVLLFRVANDESIMGQHRTSGWMRVAGLFTAIVVTIATIAYLALQLLIPGAS